MSTIRYRLVLFDCDGTLADSGRSIVASVRGSFSRMGLTPPAEPEIRRHVGLSMPQFLSELAIDPASLDVDELGRLYREEFARRRVTKGADPLFEGVRTLLQRLHANGAWLGIVTGKSRRGLNAFLEGHSCRPLFHTLQTSDDAPSKPDPTMVLQALSETGCESGEAVVVGDTVFDVGAALGAGVEAIGVSWGHHPSDELCRAGAIRVARSVAELGSMLGLEE